MTALANLVRVVSTTTGTGTLTLGAAVQGFLTPAQGGITDNQTVSYAIEADYVSNIATSREQGYGSYLSGTLTRTVSNSTNSNAALNLTGDEQVIITLKANDIREKLLGSTNFYVNPIGSDSNNGLANTAAGAFLTIQGAWTAISTNYDFNGQSVEIDVAAGTYSAGVFIKGWTGGGTLSFIGDTTTPSNVFIDATSTTGDNSGVFEIIAAPGAVSIRGFKIRSTAPAKSQILVSGSGILVITGNLELFTCASSAEGQWAIIVPGSKIQNIAAVTLSGNTPCWIAVLGASQWQSSGGVVYTTANTPAWSLYGVYTTYGGIAQLSSTSFAGTGATGTRYSADTNGIIWTGGAGASFLPGDVAGSTFRQGQYI